MKTRVAFVGAAGILIAAYLIWHIGFSSIISAAVAVGWSGFLLLCAYTLLVFVLLGSAWWVLVDGSPAQRWQSFLWARLVRDSAAENLPFSQVGGFVMGARAAILDGIAPGIAAASMIADITTEMVAELVYVCLGIVLLGTQLRHAPGIPSGAWLLTGFGLASIAAGSFYSLQRYGGGLIRNSVGRFLPQALDYFEAVTSELQKIYRAPGRIGASFLLHFGGWVASGTATWIAFRLLGAQVHFSSVISVESLIFAIRSIAFAVPNAFGVQELAHVVFAPVLGVGPELAVAVSLLKRAQNIAIGIPVLLLWQSEEGRHATSTASTRN